MKYFSIFAFFKEKKNILKIKRKTWINILNTRLYFAIVDSFLKPNEEYEKEKNIKKEKRERARELTTGNDSMNENF